ncbi:MAG: GNAT family N-acetyltransferase [Acidobacteriota bacterium]|nr:GNAT family N-acetyltransferase [Acidobacteriota bacterium]
MANSEKKITIREANASDAVLISILAATTFYEAYFEQDESTNLAGYISQSFGLNKIQSELADPAISFALIFLSEKAVGYAKLEKDSTLGCIKGHNTIELKRIYVLERVYGKGVGSKLLEYCLSLAKDRGFESLWLQVWEQNPRAQRFYEKYGFEEVGTVNVPYGDVMGTNLVLEKSL